MTREVIEIITLKNGKDVKISEWSGYKGDMKRMIDVLNTHLETDDQGWCMGKLKNCKDENSFYIPDGKCTMGCGCEKHHYHCSNCGGITQVG